MTDSPHGDERHIISTASDIIRSLETILAHTSGPAQADLQQRIHDEVDVFFYKWYDLLVRRADPDDWTPAHERRDHHLCRVIVAVLRRADAVAHDEGYPPGNYRVISDTCLIGRVHDLISVDEGTLSETLGRLCNAEVILDRTGRRFPKGAYALAAEYEQRLEALLPAA